MSDTPRLCFVTPGHIASNPRLVKEASAAAAEGYDVRVVFSQYMRELVAVDTAILERHPAWRSDAVVWTDSADGKTLRRSSGVRQRVARAMFGVVRTDTAGARALARIYDELVDRASCSRADVFVAHNLGAVPVALAAAERWKARVTFDAEDFHRGEVHASARGRALIEWAERRFIPRCSAVTAASDEIGAAYSRALGIPAPATIRNVFERADRDVELPAAVLANERRHAGRSIYWFSQTIGPDRGLEDAVDALAQLPDDIHLYVRGRWADGYETRLRAQAAARGAADRLHALDPVMPHTLVRLAACHDVGLALEQPVNENRSICVTNKLFTYLLAGIPVAASDTPGQRNAAAGSRAVRLYEPGDASALARIIRELLSDADGREAAATEALARHTWEREREVFLDIVRRLAGPAASVVATHA